MLAVALVVLGTVALLLAVRQRQNGRGSVSLGLTVGGFVLMTAALALAFMDARAVADDHQTPPAQTPDPVLPLVFFALGALDLALAVGFYRKGRPTPAAFLAAGGVGLTVVGFVLFLAERTAAP